MLKIAPSILAADFACLKDALALAEQGGADMLHVDVMDGHFVPNITIGPPVISSLRRYTALPFDVHLMIANPDAFLEAFAESGANLLTVHVEVCQHLHRTIQTIKSLGLRAGVSLNPATPLNTLDAILEDLDLVLIMSVNPGFGGQSFIPAAMRKVRELADMIAARGLNTHIQVDGGVTPENTGDLVAAGATVLVSGSAFFAHPPYAERHQIFQEAARRGRTARVVNP